MQPRVHKSEEGRLLNVLGNPMLEKAGPRDFDGHAAVFALTVLPGGGPPPHYHEGVDEFFYVLDGELDVWVGERHVTLRPGMSATLPRGVVHRFDNATSRPARVLVTVAPGSGAAFFDELDRVRPQLPQDRDKVEAILARHDIHVVEESVPA